MPTGPRHIRLSAPIAFQLRQEFAHLQRSLPVRHRKHGYSLSFFSRLAALHYHVHEKTIRDAVNGLTWLQTDVDAEPGLAASVRAMRALDPYALPWPLDWE